MRRSAPRLPVIASGGLRHGLDVAKVLGLGASLAGMAGPFLQPAPLFTEAVLELLEETTRTLRIAIFAVGARDIDALQATPPIVSANGPAQFKLKSGAQFEYFYLLITVDGLMYLIAEYAYG